MLPLPVTITSAALAQIWDIRRNKNIPEEYALRLGIRGGGCVGVGYIIGFDTPKDSDDKHSYEGLTILVDRKHAMHLLGIVLDWEDTATARGFTFMTEAEWTGRVVSEG